MEMESDSKTIGEPVGVDSLYSLAEAYGAKRYQSPFYFKVFSQGGRQSYLDSLLFRYLSLLDYLFFQEESKSYRKKVFLLELEDLIHELKALKVPRKNLQGFLETKGKPEDPLYQEILATIEDHPQKYLEAMPRPSFLFKAIMLILLAGLALSLYFM